MRILISLQNKIRKLISIDGDFVVFRVENANLFLHRGVRSLSGTLCLESRHWYRRFSAWSTGNVLYSYTDPSPQRGLGFIAISLQSVLSARRLVSEASSGGLGFGNRLVTRGLGFAATVGDQGLVIIVVRCINLAKNAIKQRRAGLAERTRASWGQAGGTVVVDSTPAQSLNFFFFLSLSKISKFFGGLFAGTRSTKFSVPVPGLQTQPS